MHRRLTDTQVKNSRKTSKPRKLTDGGGLYLEIRPSGTKLWRYRYRIAGKENVFAIGAYPEKGLQEARDDRDAAAALVKKGTHPSHHRRTENLRRAHENATTFEGVAREWMAKKTWSGYYAKQVKTFLEADVFPEIGALPMRAITAADLLPIVREVEKRGAATVAILLRQWCSQIFRYAIATLRADTDHAAALRGAIERPKVQHHKPLARSAIPGFLKALEAYGGYQTTSIALRLLLLIFVRPVELRAAEWPEFDLDGALWLIPAARMKMREEHLVPLSTQAVALLKQLHLPTGGQRWLFPNHRRPKTHMTMTTMNRALERMGYGGQFSAHGFRATASTLLNELGYRTEVIERQLAHQERNKSRASYNRAEYLEERRQMMQAWADLIDALCAGQNIVGFRRTAA